MASGTSPLLDDDRVKAVLNELHLHAATQIATIRRNVTQAVQGDDGAIARYVDAFRSLAAVLISTAPHDPEAALHRSLLENAAGEALYSDWRGTVDRADAVALDAVNRLRVATGRPLLQPPSPGARFGHSEATPEVVLRGVRRHLNHDQHEADLARLRDLFALSDRELGELFGVRPQAVAQWRANGVPAARRAKLAVLMALSDLLERKLKRERVAGLARRPAAAYEGRTMLQMISDGDENQLLDLTRDSFDWTRAA